mgnify:CR=1 FL=1
MLPSVQVVQTMSSREIAALVGSRHTDVCKSIDRLMASGDIGGYAATPYTLPQNGQTYSEYLINQRDSYVIVAQLSPSFTAKLVDRWRELEAAHAPKVPTTLSGALRLAAEQAEEIERQTQFIEQQRPAVEFVGKYVKADGNKGFREVCKLLKANEPRFKQFLIDEKIMYKLGGHLTPMAQHMDAGRFEVKTGVSGGGHAFNQAKFTPKGVEWIAGEWAKFNVRQPG